MGSIQNPQRILSMVLNTVVFDLDGTLIDSVPDVNLALNTMLAEHHLSGIALDKMYDLIGKGARFLVEAAFIEHNVSLSEEKLNAALQRYIELYRANPVVNTVIYPGVKETLLHLQEREWKLAICTNKPGIMTRLVLEKLQLQPFFSIIISGDEINNPKPHQDHLHAVINALFSTINQTVFVGDSDVDFNCAQNANVPFVGVRYGYHLGSLHSPNMISDFSDLPQMLKGMSL